MLISKINFKNNIILMHLQSKNTLKYNISHTLKQTLNNERQNYIKKTLEST